MLPGKVKVGGRGGGKGDDAGFSFEHASLSVVRVTALSSCGHLCQDDSTKWGQKGTWSSGSWHREWVGHKAFQVETGKEGELWHRCFIGVRFQCVLER